MLNQEIIKQQDQEFAMYDHVVESNSSLELATPAENEPLNIKQDEFELSFRRKTTTVLRFYYLKLGFRQK